MKRSITFIVDLGHGGADNGACHNGIVESQYVLSVGHELLMIVDGCPWHTHLTRTRDIDPSFAERGAFERSMGADFVWALHINAFFDRSVRGGECYIWPGNELARRVAHELCDSLPMPLRRDVPKIIEAHKPDPADKGTRWIQRPRNVLAIFRAPTVLAELAFCSSPHDAEYLSRPYSRRALAWTIAASMWRAYEELQEAES